jgi:hypothetical protein
MNQYGNLGNLVSWLRPLPTERYVPARYTAPRSVNRAHQTREYEPTDSGTNKPTKLSTANPWNDHMSSITQLLRVGASGTHQAATSNHCRITRSWRVEGLPLHRPDPSVQPRLCRRWARAPLHSSPIHHPRVDLTQKRSHIHNLWDRNLCPCTTSSNRCRG